MRVLRQCHTAKVNNRSVVAAEIAQYMQIACITKIWSDSNPIDISKPTAVYAISAKRVPFPNGS